MMVRFLNQNGFRLFYIKVCLSLLIYISFPSHVFAVAKISLGTGGWNTGTNWSPAGVPGAADDVTIASGHIITMDLNGATCLSLAINGTATWSAANTVTVGASGITIANTGNITGTGAGILSTSGNLTINATLSSTTVGVTMTGTGRTISGTGSLAILNITGNTSNTGTLTVTTTLGGSGARTLTNAASATLNIGAATVTPSITATAVPNTVNYIGATTQTVRAATYYNLTINKTVGTAATSGGVITVNNNLTITSGTFTNATGNLSVTAGTTTVGSSGTFQETSTTGTDNFLNVVLNSGATWTYSAAETFTISGNMTMSGVNITGSATGTFTIAGALTISASSTNTIGAATFNVTGTTTVNGSVDFNSTTGNKNLGNVVIANTGTWTSTLGESFTISGNFQNDGSFTSGAGTYTFSGAAKAISGLVNPTFTRLSVSGTCTNNCSSLTVSTALAGAGTLTQGANSQLFITGTSAITGLTCTTNTPNTVEYNGGGAQTIKSTTYHHLRKTGAGTSTLGGAITINGNFAITAGTFACNTFQINGNATGTFTMSASTTLTLGTTASATVVNFPTNFTTANTTLNATSTVTYQCNVAQTVSATPAYGNLTITTGATSVIKTTSASTLTVNGTLTITTAGAGLVTFTLGAAATLNGNVSVSSGTFNSATFQITGNALRTFTLAAGASLSLGTTGSATAVSFPTNYTVGNITLNATSTVSYLSNTASQTISTTPTYGNLTISTGSTLTKTLGGTLNASGTLTLTSAAGTLTLNAGANTINLTGTGSLSGAGTLTFTTGTLNIGGSNNGHTGTFNAGTGTVNFNGTGAQNVRGTTYHHLTINKSAGTATLAAAPTINGNLTISTGTLDCSTFSIIGNASGTMTMSSGTSLLLGTTASATAVSFPSAFITGNITLNSNSTVNYRSNTATQTISSTPTYGNLTITTGNAAVTKPLSASPLNVAGNMTLTNGTATVTLGAATNTINLTGNLTGTGTLSFSSGTLNIAGNNNGHTGTFTPGTGTVNFNRSGAQTVRSTTYNHITFSGSGTKTLAGAITTTGDLTISSTLDVSTSNFGVNVAGNWANNGTFTAQSGTVTFNGAAAQTIGGSTVTNFNNISITNASASGVSLTSTQNLVGILTLGANAKFITTGQTFTLLSTATGTASIATIPGTATFTGNITMQRYVPGGSTGWTQIGSPVSGRTIADWQDDFSTSGFTGASGSAAGFISVYTYTESTTGTMDLGYVAATNSTNTLSVGEGRAVYVGDGATTTNDITIDVTGAPFTGNQVMPITYTNDPGQPASEDGWNLIANPYPAPISWSALRALAGTPANIDDAVYLWNADLNGGTGGYAQYVGGVSSPAVGSGGIGNTIPSSQAFWIHLTGTTTLTATESIKTTGNPTFLKTMSESAQQNDPSLLRLILNNSNYRDETVVRLHPDATTRFDNQFDAYKLFNGIPESPNICTVINSDNYAINSVSNNPGDLTIPVRVKVGSSGNYTISGLIENIPNINCITLEDRLNGSIIDLKTNPSYTFYISDTTQAPRFVIHVNISVNTETYNASCHGSNDGRIVVAGSPNNSWSYSLTTIDNKTIVSNKTNRADTDTIPGLSAGKYVLHFNGTTSLCGSIITDTITISEPDPVTADFTASAQQIELPGATPVYFYNNSSNAISFAWDFGDQSSINNDFAPEHTYMTGGTYTVKLIAYGTCKTDTALTTITVNNAPDTTVVTGIINVTGKEDSNVKITMADGKIIAVVNFDHTENVQLSVLTNEGKLITEQNNELSVGTVELPSATLTAGIYFVNVRTSTTNYSKRIYIQQ